jgi:hypothetical protein
MTKKTATIDSTQFAPRFLSVKRGISRAIHSYGYTRITITIADPSTGRKVTSTGGGYDMTGTALGKWMEAHIQDRLDMLQPGTKRVSVYPSDAYGSEYQSPLYGIQYKGTKSGSGYEYTRASVDGGCGLSSMQSIALACGIAIEEVWDRSTRNGKLIGFYVREVAA